MYVRLFAAVWLLVCAFLAVVAWGFQAPFSYDPVGPRAYPLLLLGLMAVAALWLLCKPSGEPTLPISWVLLPATIFHPHAVLYLDHHWPAIVLYRRVEQGFRPMVGRLQIGFALRQTNTVKCH